MNEPSRPGRSSTAGASSANRRLQCWYGVLILIVWLIFIARLFYLQIIRHDHYHTAALSDQLKQYSIAPQRGIIEAQDGSSVVPIVLNQKLYTLYADPTLVKNASQLTPLSWPLSPKAIANQYNDQMHTKGTRYVVLAKRLSHSQNNQITGPKTTGHRHPGPGLSDLSAGQLAAQLLGFVNNNGPGQYGIEQALK